MQSLPIQESITLYQSPLTSSLITKTTFIHVNSIYNRGLVQIHGTILCPIAFFTITCSLNIKSNIRKTKVKIQTTYFMLVYINLQIWLNSATRHHFCMTRIWSSATYIHYVYKESLFIVCWVQFMWGDGCIAFKHKLSRFPS